MFKRNLIIVDEFGDGEAGFVVESLRFYEDCVVETSPEGVEFWLFPGKMMNFSIKIGGEETKIMASEVVFGAGVAEKSDKFHGLIIAWKVYPVWENVV